MKNISTEILQQITSQQAYAYRIVPFQLRDNQLYCYTDQVTDDKAKELKVILGLNVKLEHCETNVIQLLLSQYYRQQNTSAKQLKVQKDFIENLLLEVFQMGGSDIHFEAFEKKAIIRVRLDGKLKEHFVVKRDEYPVMVNKIKIKAGLDISEKRLPQDGRISIQQPNINFDVRVSSLPTLHGEKLVLRLLNKDAGAIQLGDLGLTAEELSNYQSAYRKPNGIILISGPTGSGKTTTLYATLKELNQTTANILTIEDPIEYTLEGINQVQLKENIGLNFPKALRTFLRQDPDIIMVGEIRDVDTANMAIRASLTGHLVLSTIHTNSAWATISRLIDMGIPNFLVANTLNASIAQRLVRVLCTLCKAEIDLDELEIPDKIKKQLQNKKIHKAVGCNHCYQTGYSGRQAIYEIINITEELVEAIRDNQLNINKYIKNNNIPTLTTNAIRLLDEGVTSYDEVFPILIS